MEWSRRASSAVELDRSQRETGSGFRPSNQTWARFQKTSLQPLKFVALKRVVKVRVSVLSCALPLVHPHCDDAQDGAEPCFSGATLARADSSYAVLSFTTLSDLPACHCRVDMLRNPVRGRNQRRIDLVDVAFRDAGAGMADTSALMVGRENPRSSAVELNECRKPCAGQARALSPAIRCIARVRPVWCFCHS